MNGNTRNIAELDKVKRVGTKPIAPNKLHSARRREAESTYIRACFYRGTAVMNIDRGKILPCLLTRLIKLETTSFNSVRARLLIRRAEIINSTRIIINLNSLPPSIPLIFHLKFLPSPCPLPSPGATEIIGRTYVPRCIKRSFPRRYKRDALYLDQASLNEFIPRRTRRGSVSDCPGYTTGLRMIHATISSQKRTNTFTLFMSTIITTII